MEVKNTSVIYLPKSSESKSVNPEKLQSQPETETIEIQEKITKEMLINKVDKMNEIIEPTSTAIKYKLHEELNVYYVQVLDAKTDTVLKEIPNKKFLDMYASMAELMGLIVDDKF